MLRSLVGSEMCIRDRYQRRVRGLVNPPMSAAVMESYQAAKQHLASLSQCRRILPRAGSSNMDQLEHHTSAARALLRQLLLDDVQFAHAKNVEHKLWLEIDYKSIDQCQQIVRRQHKAGDPSDEASARLADLLQAASRFYYELVNELAARYEIDLSGNTERASDSVSMAALRVLQQQMVVLGDVGRYWQQHQARQQLPQDWTSTVMYYGQALRLLPSDGKVHNQLAVVAMYGGNTMEAMYRYFRAMNTSKPFPARENLQMLFDKANAEKKPSPSSWFVRVQGMLFTRIGLDGFERTMLQGQQQLHDWFAGSLEDPDIGIKVGICCVMAVHNAEHVQGVEPWQLVGLVVPAMLRAGGSHLGGAAVLLEWIGAIGPEMLARVPGSVAETLRLSLEKIETLQLPQADVDLAETVRLREDQEICGLVLMESRVQCRIQSFSSAMMAHETSHADTEHEKDLDPHPEQSLETEQTIRVTRLPTHVRLG
eukprot:TRINITY_DN9654_c0_g1_i2.p1 TRINITY_DN9654_c0_g1~~TRINITY_DN9654_c0_g1_i2.p1  ORF type:complete len:482 (-),score=123.15 TRINITY_DN9654_c0_g1_i2:185-1630(-)